MKSILVTGAEGQIGSDLVDALCARHGAEHVLATDLRPAPRYGTTAHRYEALDVRDAARLREVAERYEIDTVYHLASLLSAVGEQKPELCWDVNVNGLRHVLDVARALKLQVFWPSSIAAFGPETPRLQTPQTTVLDPTTMYGITKVSGELLCRYYAEHFGVDVRSVRFPGIISYSAPPGGGTTDYAVAIFHEALQKGRYTCFVRADTVLPMMYMPDAIRSMLAIMDAPAAQIRVRTSYNLAAISFSAAELATEIRRRLPHFAIAYAPDSRQAIADSWPAVIDDRRAREDWGWHHEFDLAALVDDMLAHLAPKLNGSAGRRPAQPFP